MTIHKLLRSRRPRPLLVVSVAAMLLAADAACASGASSIEGVWSFNGGNVAIQAQPDGTLIGTVVAPTTFALCTHPVGEQMWTGIRPQADGSYRGAHQWYLEPTCMVNPTLGPTTWRILHAADAAYFLRVCFSYPGSSQPVIGPDGSSSEATSPPCLDSALIAPLPVGEAPASRAGAQSFARSVSLPSASRCLSRRAFQIHLHDPKNDPLREVLVTLRGRRLAAVRRARSMVATIDLTGLPRGAFTVTIHLTTVLGHHLASSRTYRTCMHSSSSPKRAPLRRTGRRHV